MDVLAGQGRRALLEYAICLSRANGDFVRPANGFGWRGDNRRFQEIGLGKVIGMRTWGGEIWLSSSNRLVDNGIATAAEFGVYGPEGKWLIEGRGVEPDMTVDNLPYETYKGKDAQLEFAVDYLKKQIKEHPDGSASCAAAPG